MFVRMGVAKKSSLFTFISFLEIDPALVERFLDAAWRGDVLDIIGMLNDGVPVDRSLAAEKGSRRE